MAVICTPRNKKRYLFYTKSLFVLARIAKSDFLVSMPAAHDSNQTTEERLTTLETKARGLEITCGLLAVGVLIVATTSLLLGCRDVVQEWPQPALQDQSEYRQTPSKRSTFSTLSAPLSRQPIHGDSFPPSLTATPKRPCAPAWMDLREASCSPVPQGTDHAADSFSSNRLAAVPTRSRNQEKTIRL